MAGILMLEEERHGSIQDKSIVLGHHTRLRGNDDLFPTIKKKPPLSVYTEITLQLQDLALSRNCFWELRLQQYFTSVYSSQKQYSWCSLKLLSWNRFCRFSLRSRYKVESRLLEPSIFFLNSQYITRTNSRFPS